MLPQVRESAYECGKFVYLAPAKRMDRRRVNVPVRVNGRSVPMNPQSTSRTCSIEGCEKPAKTRGWCDMHYSRWKRHGDPRWERPVKTCSIDGCDRPSCARGWCQRHYLRWYYHGDPLTILTNKGKSKEERFWMKVDRRSDDQCWEWQASLNQSGYGWASVDGRSILAHRLAYELVNGPIPYGLDIDHLCFNRRCVNPAHLEAVTHEENVRRYWEANPKTHCIHGHALTEDNLYYDKRGYGSCITCRRDASRRLSDRRKVQHGS